MVFPILEEYGEELVALGCLIDHGGQPSAALLEKINADLCKATGFRIAMTRWRLGFLFALSEGEFHHMMSSLERRKQVEGWNEEQPVDGRDELVRWYRITQEGRERRSSAGQKAA